MMGEARHRGPQPSQDRKWNGDKEHEFKMGPWVRASRRRWELRMFKFDHKQNRTVGAAFALVLADDGVWHMWTVDGREWDALKTMGLLTAKVRFYQHLRAAGWRLKEGEMADGTAAAE